MQNEKMKFRDDQTSGTPAGSSDRLDRNMGTGCLLEAVLVPLDGVPPALVLVHWPVSVISSTLWSTSGFALHRMNQMLIFWEYSVLTFSVCASLAERFV